MRWVAGVAAATLCGAAHCCDLRGARIDSPRYALAWRTLPHPIAVGQHFSLEIGVCAKAGAAAPESVGVDAHMPEHRHGMNYKVAVTAQGEASYRAEGLMFHMPGRWELVFELRSGGTTERLMQSLVLE